MKKRVTRTKITPEVKSTIGLLWISYNKELQQNPKRKFKIQELLNIVNREIKVRKLRDEISSSQLYVEIAQLKANKEKINTFKDNPFSIGIFLKSARRIGRRNSFSSWISTMYQTGLSGVLRGSKCLLSRSQAEYLPKEYILKDGFFVFI